MKGIFRLSWSLFACMFMLSSEAAYQKYNHNDQMISEDDDDEFQDAQDWDEILSSSETLIATPVSTRIEAQRYLCDKYGDDSHNVSILPLKQLTDQYLIATAKSLEDVADDPRSTLLHLDMFDGANCSTLISGALNNILSGEDESLQDLYEAIQNNESLAQSIEDLRLLLSDLSSYGSVDFSDKEYARKYGQSLQAFTDLLADIDTITFSEPTGKSGKVKDVKFRDKYGYFVEFLEVSKKISDLVFVRYNTEKVLSATRAALEGIQSQTLNKASSYSVVVPTPIPGMSATLDLFVSKLSQGTNALSFCSVTTTKGAKAGLSFNILPAKISGKFDVEQANIELFYSLEAYMDYMNTKSIVSLDKLQARVQGMKKALNDRKSMQEKEKEALKYSGTFERYLKMFKAMPMTGVSLDWITVTQSAAKGKAKELSFGAEIDAGISVASIAELGINVKASHGKKEYIKESSLLSLLKEDCSIDKGFTIEDLRDLIGEEYDIRENVGTANNLLGFLDGYVFTLEQLATTESRAARNRLEEEKHRYEKILMEEKDSEEELSDKGNKVNSQKTKKRDKGREGVLKAAILTAGLLREESPDNQEYSLRFKKIYDQLERLAKLGTFSKNNSGIRKLLGFGKKAIKQDKATADIRKLEAQFKASEANLGTISATATRKTVKNSPLLQENGKYISLNFDLPISSAGVLGMAVIKSRTKNLFADASSASASLSDFADIGMALGGDTASKVAYGINQVIPVAASVADQGITQRLNLPGLSGKISEAGKSFSVKMNGMSAFNYTWKYVDALTYTSGVEPLPGKKIVENKKGKWVLDFVTITTAVNLNGSYLGRAHKITGSNTLHDLTSKFNVLSMGRADSKSKESTAIDGLFKGQTASLVKLFQNIATMKGNAAFELQMLYNELISNYRNESKDSRAKKAEISKLFSDFIEACEDLSNSDERLSDSRDTMVTSKVADVPQDSEIKSILSEDEDDRKGPTTEQFKKALGLFRKIMDKQYEEVFKPHYDSAFFKTNNDVDDE